MLNTREELLAKDNTVISQETLVEIHYIIKNARRNLGLQVDISSEIVLPFQPLLMNIVNLTKTGCSVYYRMLRKKTNLKTTLSARENKWHLELGCTFGVDFWNRTYSLVSKIKFENKYLQYQINRNSLFTNYRVSKFQRHISPYCRFCLQAQSPTM